MNVNQSELILSKQQSCWNQLIKWGSCNYNLWEIAIQHPMGSLCYFEQSAASPGSLKYERLEKSSEIWQYYSLFLLKTLLFLWIFFLCILYKSLLELCYLSKCCEFNFIQVGRKFQLTEHWVIRKDQGKRWD